MEKCECWLEEHPAYAFGSCRCLGTKELDSCDCGGDEAKCDFYPQRRQKALEERAKMSRAIVTLKDGRTFEHDGCVEVKIMKKQNLLKITMDDDGFNFYTLKCVDNVRYVNNKEGV